jgi:long-chain fatty acid transport protein
MKMRKLNLKSRIITTLLVVLFSASTAFATDGYFGVGYDTKSKGMAGAGIALYQNSFFGASNPASMVLNGKKFGVSLGLFNPNRSYTITGAPTSSTSWTPEMLAGQAQPPFGLTPGKVESDSKFFPMPSLVANWMLNEKSSFGISLYGNGGMNTNYPTKTFISPYFPAQMTGNITQPTGVNLMQMFGAFTYSKKLGEKWSMGVSAIIAWQSFEAKGLQIFGNFPGFATDATKLTNNGANSSFGFGGKIGIQGELADGFFIGATYQTKMYMGEFDKYSSLFAEAGDFDIPSSWTIGIAYELSQKWTFAFDVKQICYNNVKSIANPMNMQAQLGTETGSGFGWNRMTILKTGFEYKASDGLKLRTGFSHGNNPIRSTDVLFNILAPGVIENHITIGLSKMIGDKELNVALVHALSSTISGPNPMEFPRAQTIGLNMNQWELEIGITF